jgi:hypothetical protein
LKAGNSRIPAILRAEMTPQSMNISRPIDNMHPVHTGGGGTGKQKEADIRSISNGKVWTGEQALSMKLSTS